MGLFDQLQGMLQPQPAEADQQIHDLGNNIQAQTSNFSKASEAVEPVTLPNHIMQALEYVSWREDQKLYASKDPDAKVSKPYPDDAGSFAIGFGTKENPLSGKPVKPGDPAINKDEAQMGVLKKLAELDSGLKGPGFDNLSQTQRASVLSALYNLKPNSGQQLLKRIGNAMKTGDEETAADAFGLFNKGTDPQGNFGEMRGLTERREEEASMFRGIPFKGAPKALKGYMMSDLQKILQDAIRKPAKFELNDGNTAGRAGTRN